MTYFASLLEFSHTHCVAICAVLVPINLLVTLQTILLAALGHKLWVRRTAALAGLCAGVMVLHVLTWFVIGVVAVQTYILLTLGGICLGVNLWAVLHSPSMRKVLLSLRHLVLRSAYQS
jgi:hypothetical protein